MPTVPSVTNSIKRDSITNVQSGTTILLPRYVVDRFVAGVSRPEVGSEVSWRRNWYSTRT